MKALFCFVLRVAGYEFRFRVSNGYFFKRHVSAVGFSLLASGQEPVTGSQQPSKA
jgi:hypothetical protein